MFFEEEKKKVFYRQRAKKVFLKLKLVKKSGVPARR